MKYIIYLRTNTANGKQYVGQTSDFRQRNNDWNRLKYRYANKHINNDRAEFGLENFTVEVLAEVETREEAWELEQHYINEFNTLWPNGYNISTGGAGGSGVKLSDETKLKMSDAKKGENNPFYGRLNREDKSKQVYQYTKDKVLVKVWASTMECGRNGYNQGAVAACCRNCYFREGNNIYKNHIWSYTEL